MSTAPHSNTTKPLRLTWRDRLVLLCVLLAGTALTLLAGSSLQKAEVLRTQKRISTATQAVVSVLNLELVRTTEAVRNAGLMLGTDTKLSREQFNRHMQQMVENQLSVNLIEWQPIVPAHQLAQFEVAARAKGLPNFRVVQPNASGTGWEPVHGRKEYVPVLFAWPEKYRTEGLDMSFSPERMASKLQSRTLRAPVASGTFEVMKEGVVKSGSVGIAISSAVFDSHQNAKGYLAAVVDLSTLFEEATRLADAAKFDLLVFDSTTPQATPIYAWHGTDSNLKQTSATLRLDTTQHASTSINFAHQAWSLVLHPRPTFYAQMQENSSPWVYAAGIAGTLLIVMVLFQLQIGRQKIQRSESAANHARMEQVVQRQQLEEAQRIAHVGSWQMDRAGNQMWSDEMYRIVGLRPGPTPPPYQQISTLFPPESWEQLVAALTNTMECGTPCELELKILKADGSRGWMLVHGEAVWDEGGDIVGARGTATEITERKEHERQLQHIAHFDAVTNLPNRVLLADRLQQAMAQEHRRGQQLAVAYLDLDGFKTINDQYGHETGDQVLSILATRMHETLREGDTLARLGGDEFVAVLIDLDNSSSSIPLLNRLLAAAALPVQVGKLTLQVSASLGVTFYPQANDIQADQLLRQADQAMYQAKVAGKNRYHVFDAAQDSSIRVHHETLERIRQALAQGEFVLHYQPKVNMRNGQVMGVEALIRWQHPDKGLLAPATFLPIIEDDPLAIEVGEWVIETALNQISAWRAAGLEMAVSVNIGARQLQQANFVQRLENILAKHPQPHSASLELEVLETSALADIGQVSQVIEECAQMGVKFALDDFGTGYSSLTYLKRLRVTLLKIDQSFVRDMLDDPDDLAILQGVIGLAAAFKRDVIAEGVETVAHGTLLLELGCEMAQGFGIARPMPPEHLPIWVASWRPDVAWAS